MAVSFFAVVSGIDTVIQLMFAPAIADWADAAAIELTFVVEEEI
jgi:hypothetical protein